MARYLVVGNETLDSEQLLGRLHELAEGGAEFHLLVPATHPRSAWTDAQVEATARERMERVVDRWVAEGLRVTGEPGDVSPYRAIGDVLLRDERFDAIVLSTHPIGVSRWLRQDVVHKVERDYRLPVIHIMAPAPVLARP